MDAVQEMLSSNMTFFFEDLEKEGLAPPTGPGPIEHVHHHDHDAHTGHHLMKMWFHGGWDEVILFDCWRINSLCGLVVSCLLIFVMGAAYEGIKWFRVYIQMTFECHCNMQGGGCGAGGKQEMKMESLLEEERYNGCGCQEPYQPTTTLVQPTEITPRRPQVTATRRWLLKWSPAVLYMVQLVLAYWLMLIVMTYNSWLTAAVILGAGFGHWLFAVLKFLNPRTEIGDSMVTDACH